MSNIVFHCPKCRQKIKAPEIMAGEIGDCPGCKTPLVIPRPQKKDSASPSAATQKSPSAVPEVSGEPTLSPAPTPELQAAAKALAERRTSRPLAPADAPGKAPQREPSPPAEAPQKSAPTPQKSTSPETGAVSHEDIQRAASRMLKAARDRTAVFGAGAKRPAVLCMIPALLSLIPGLGQAYNLDVKRAGLFAALFLLSVGVAVFKSGLGIPILVIVILLAMGDAYTYILS